MARSLAVIIVLGSALLWSAHAAPLRVTPEQAIRQAEAQKVGRPLSLDADSLHSYDQIALSLDYRVEDAAVPMTGHAYITLVGRQPQSQIALNCEGITVSQVTEHNSSLPFTVQNDTLYITRSFPPNDTATFDIQVSVPARSHDLGFNWAPRHAYTFAEPWGARRWFPCFDQPFDKFNEITVAVNMPDYWELASNGALVEISFPESGRKREVYHHGYHIATYLVMATAGSYTRFYQTVNGVEYRYFTFPEHAGFVQTDWQRTPQMVAIYDSLFGAYPFDEYGMVEAEIGGAMEHQTFTTMDPHFQTGNRQNEPVVAHELSHQWFGDDITCVDFRNIWLNEGFATYCANLFYQAADGEDVFQSQIAGDMGVVYDEDQHYLRYAIYDPPDSLIFGATEYYKGAVVLHMLREQIMGDSLFFAGLRHYVATYAGGNVSTDDFSRAMSDVYGQDLHWFFEQWVYQAGYPVIEYTIQPGVPTATDVTVFVHQTQFDPARHTPYFRFPLLLDVQTASGTVTRQFWFNAQEFQSVTESFPANVQGATLAPVQPLLVIPTPVAVGPLPTGIAGKFELGAVYPNPFNSAARIPFELAKTGDVKVDVFDVTGRHVETLVDERMVAGRHEIAFSATPGMATGVYLISLESGGSRKITKAMFVK